MQEARLENCCFIQELFVFSDIQELVVFGIWGLVRKLRVRALGVTA